ncbi:MAG: phosphoribosylformylglycinamidine synthase [Sulfuricurvum sp. PC08-66]|nr:MAG: phosphoribosylformylglycinamidine synthase [Sulfuricurvum sp. PC08-66]
MNVAITLFPGTNCDTDTQYAFEKLGHKATILWHKERTIPANTDLVVIAGGFSYGDYLRSGAIARFSPIVEGVIAHANKGGKVLGICNGFQILTEARLLPGALKRNEHLHFISKHQHVRVENNQNDFLRLLKVGDVLNLPIAHADGNYYADAQTIAQMEQKGQVLLRYSDASGAISNPNGSVGAIAGICNETKNVFGLMPHPERAIEILLGSDDGIKMLQGFASL